MDSSTITLIGAAGTICGLIFGYIGYKRGLQKDSTDSGRSAGTLMSDIGYIKAGIDDLKHKQESAELRHFALAERVTKVEESSKQAHKRIDRLESKEGE